MAGVMLSWRDIVPDVFLVTVAAATGAIGGFWLAAEWNNLDDREMVGDPFPYLAMILSTVGGALVLGVPVLLAVLWWD